MSIIESLRRIDAKIEEKVNLKVKYPNHYELIDVAARNSFLITKVSIAIIKCSNGFNQYAARDKVLNYRLAVKECPRCSQHEIQAHIIQCKETFKMRVDFIINLKDKLTKHKHLMVSDKEIDKMIYDIRMFLVENKKLKTNQQYIRFEAMFCR